MEKTLFDKIWDAHVVGETGGDSSILYIDRLYCHEVTSAQAFDGLRKRGLDVFRKSRVFCAPDHNIPTEHQDRPISDPVSRHQVETLRRNANEFGLRLFDIRDPHNGIIHVIGPESGLTLPGQTLLCGDSHTSTHGALGCIAFGIGTSEVEMVLATQCLLQAKPKTMRINVEGELGQGVTAKDVALYIIAQLTTGGATGYFVEYAGEAIRSLSMEGRMTLCNMSIEMGARGGMVAPDDKTFEYVKERESAPKGEEFEKAVEYWRTLKSDEGARFDREVTFNAADIKPRITFGTNPGMGIAIDEPVPDVPSDNAAASSYVKALEYMGFTPGQKLEGTPVDYVFLGSCTNGRIEDFRAFASLVEGQHKAEGITAWLVPGSQQVLRQIKEEGLDRILEEAGFELREPGCSACLAMNDDKIPEGKLCVSTSNRNFEGRQGPGARTILASPFVAAATALTGRLTDPRNILRVKGQEVRIKDL
ncbi:MAG: 3-isopropylmalate dehydratase large subunit [Muribaculaceae bacterium]|nr:3-isopropylmalate dehydratase large subunit [Muribaculaceae bacterium]